MKIRFLEKIKSQIQLVKHGPYDLSTPEGRDKERTRRIALTALTALVARIIAVITPLITVRITLGYLGTEIYGLWLAVSSFFHMVTYADLGLGSGLQTELSRASALEDRRICKQLVSTTFFILVGVALALLIVFASIYNFIDWFMLVNATSEEAKSLAGGVVAAILIPRIVHIPLAIIQRTQNAMQESYKTNLWQIIGNILSLLFVFVISWLGAGKLLMIFASSSISVIVAAINMLYYFGKERPELRPSISLYDKHISKRLLNTGIAFFVLSIFTTLSLNIDSWIVAKISSLEEVTPFSIMLKITSLINVVSAMLSTPLWAANGEALERGEVEWVKHKTNQIAKLSLYLSSGMSVILLLLAKPALFILSDGVVPPNYNYLVGMCILNIITATTSPYFMILNGGRVIVFQIINYFIYSIISLPAKFCLGSIWGVGCIPWIGSIMYAILLTIPTYIRAQKVIASHKTI